MSIRKQTVAELIDGLAARSPAPGGGAAAALLAAIGAALAEMVVNYSRGKKNLAQHDALYHDVAQLLLVNRAAALVLAEEDAHAYANLSRLQKLGPEDPRRVREWEAAVDRALSVPQRILELSIDLLNLCEQLAGRSNPMLRSDLAIAAIAAEAAAASAAWNIRANLPLLTSGAERSRTGDNLEHRLRDAAELRQRIEQACG